MKKIFKALLGGLCLLSLTFVYACGGEAASSQNGGTSLSDSQEEEEPEVDNTKYNGRTGAELYAEILETVRANAENFSLDSKIKATVTSNVAAVVGATSRTDFEWTLTSRIQGENRYASLFGTQTASGGLAKESKQEGYYVDGTLYDAVAMKKANVDWATWYESQGWGLEGFGVPVYPLSENSLAQSTFREDVLTGLVKLKIPLSDSEKDKVARNVLNSVMDDTGSFVISSFDYALYFSKDLEWQYIEMDCWAKTTGTVSSTYKVSGKIYPKNFGATTVAVPDNAEEYVEESITE